MGFLADPSKRTDFFDPIKYIPFGDNPQLYLSPAYYAGPIAVNIGVTYRF
ncbi:MAG: hypothetical protein WCA38_01815 [Candidatus Acidiferrales bacterium]